MMLHTHMEPPVPPAEAKPDPEIEYGTVISWDPQSGTGRILSDKDEQAIFVHQCDILHTGEGKRRLPVWHQCEFQRSVVNGSDVASRVSRTHGRPYVFEKDKNAPGPSKNLPPPADAKETPPADDAKEATVENVVEKLVEKLLQYQCRLTTNSTIQTGKVYFFHGEFRYGAIIPDNDTDVRIFADASSFNVIGSFLNVRKGLCVEYQTGKNSEGKEVATNVTGSGRKSIDHETPVEVIVPQKLGRKRKNGPAQSRTGKKMKTMSDVDTKPVIPEGKNPISIFYEFANCCNPKRIPSVKLVSQNTRPSGMVSDFTFEARLDDKPIAQGRAKTKKDAKTYAAHYALEHLENESAVYKQELARIKKGVPSVKKQMRNFTKRRWRPRFSGPGAGNGLGNSAPYTPTNNPSASYIYQPAVVLANQIPAVSLTTYNPVNNTTSTSYMNPATAQKFVPQAAPKGKKATSTYAQPQPTYYSNQPTAYDANRYAAFGNYASVQSSVPNAQYAARATPTATSVPTNSNPWQNPVAAYSNAATQQVYQQQPQAYSYQARKT